MMLVHGMLVMLVHRMLVHTHVTSSSDLSNIIISYLCRSRQSSPPPFLPPPLNEYNQRPTDHVDMYRLRWRRREWKRMHTNSGRGLGFRVTLNSGMDTNSLTEPQRDEWALPPMYVCMYVCIYVCVCLHVCMSVSMYVCIYVCVCLHVCMSVSSASFRHPNGYS
jgi:hypothetical protein